MTRVTRILGPRVVCLALFVALAACESATVGKDAGRETPTAARTDPIGGPWDTMVTAPGVTTQDPASVGDAEPQTSYDPSKVPGRVTVAMLAPLSGERAALGKTILHAAQMALFDAAGERFVLRPYDTMGTPEGAQLAAIRAVEDGVRLVLGPVFSSSVQAASPITRKAGINIIAFSNDRSVAQPGTFLIGHLPGPQIERVVSFASSQGVRRLAALVPDNPFGVRIAAALDVATRAKGATVARIITYGSDRKSIDTAVRDLADYDQRHKALVRLRTRLTRRGDDAALAEIDKLKNIETVGDVDFEVVLVPTAGDAIQSIIARLPYYDVPSGQVRVLGLSTWQGLDIAREPSLRGAWYPTAGTDQRPRFEQQFEALFGYRPGSIGVLAYDAMAVAATLVRSEEDPDLSETAITHPAGFIGMSGLFRFRLDGLCDRAYAVSEIGPLGVRIVSEAKESFDERAEEPSPGVQPPSI